MTGSPIVVLDIGTASVKCLVGEGLGTDQLKIIGLGTAPCRGLRQGVVIDMPSVVEAIRVAVDEAEQTAGLSIAGAYMGMAGDTVQMRSNRSAIAISGSSTPIDEEDVQRAVATAEQSEASGPQNVLHRFTHSFAVDGLAVKNPLWLHGNKLEVEMLSLTAPSDACATLERAASGAGVEIAGFLHSTLAAADVLVTPDEREMGIAILDIGAGSTDVAIIHESLRHIATVPFGGDDLTKDLSVVLGTTPREAEQLKCNHGWVVKAPEEAPNEVDFHSTGGRRHTIAGDQMSAILEARQREILEFVGRIFTETAATTPLAAGVVITGGGSQLAHLDLLAEEVLDMPVRIGQAIDLTGPDAVHTPQFATAAGLLHYALFSQNDPVSMAPTAAGKGGLLGKLTRLFSVL